VAQDNAAVWLVNHHLALRKAGVSMELHTSTRRRRTPSASGGSTRPARQHLAAATQGVPRRPGAADEGV